MKSFKQRLSDFKLKYILWKLGDEGEHRHHGATFYIHKGLCPVCDYTEFHEMWKGFRKI